MYARYVVLVMGLSLGAPGLAQPRFGPAPGSGHQAASPATPSQETRPFAASPQLTPESERCANFGRELRAAREQERQASTTTARDQTATHRQKIFEAKQKAGC